VNKGTIFSIEEFAINDGPGIRTTVFLKGCPLACEWCHNPEGQSFQPQIMHEKDRDRICGEVVDAEDLAKRLLRDKDFYEMNEGGVTFTGGEPTSQPAFLLELLDLLDDVHTAVETCGQVRKDIFEKVLDKADYMLYDVKHTDSKQHRRYTAVGNELILDNLNTLCESDTPFVIRIPLIPGVNDSRDNMLSTLQLIRGAKNLQRVELLRYHKTAGAKYSMVDRTYSPSFDTEMMPQLHDVFTEANIKTIIL